MKLLHIALLLMLTTVTACGSMKIEQFENSGPPLVLEEYFLGKSKAWGIFEDRFGDVRAEFTVDINGTWDGTTLTLVEDFVYKDGREDQRIWYITKTGDNTYEGRASDVIGVAKGTVAGNALNWAYDMDLAVGDKTWRVHFNDWMFLQPGGALINRAKVTKWGFEVGEVTLFFMREDAQDSEQE